MKAWILEHQGPLETHPLTLADMPMPVPHGDEIRIRITHCGICRTDLHIAEGDLELQTHPIILGHEVVGFVNAVGEKSTAFSIGERVGAYWLHDSCGECSHCRNGQENYCPQFQATGWHAQGGFAEYMTLPEESALSLEHLNMRNAEITPLLCPGIAGYAAFALTDLHAGQRLGLFGYGPTAYYVLKVAQSLGIQVFVSTRTSKNQQRARQEDAAWVGDSQQEPLPNSLHAAILFPPAGNLVEPILSHLEPGGSLVMAPVHSSPISIKDYSLNLWGRTIKTLYHLTRRDARKFIQLAPGLNLNLGIQTVAFDELPEAMLQIKHGATNQPNTVLEIQREDALNG